MMIVNAYMGIPFIPITFMREEKITALVNEETTIRKSKNEPLTQTGGNQSIVGSEVLVTEAFVDVSGEVGGSSTYSQVHSANPYHEHPLTSISC